MLCCRPLLKRSASSVNYIPPLSDRGHYNQNATTLAVQQLQFIFVVALVIIVDDNTFIHLTVIIDFSVISSCVTCRYIWCDYSLDITCIRNNPLALSTPITANRDHCWSNMFIARLGGPARNCKKMMSTFLQSFSALANKSILLISIRLLAFSGSLIVHLCICSPHL